MKEREDRQMERKEGNYLELRTVLLSNELIEFDEQVQPKKRGEKNEKEIKESVKAKQRPRSRINARNALSTNNQAVIKIEKEIKIKDSLQRKLDKLQKQYKHHFKDVNIKDGLEIKNNKEESEPEQS